MGGQIVELRPSLPWFDPYFASINQPACGPPNVSSLNPGTTPTDSSLKLSHIQSWLLCDHIDDGFVEVGVSALNPRLFPRADAGKGEGAGLRVVAQLVFFDFDISAEGAQVAKSFVLFVADQRDDRVAPVFE